MCKSNRLLKNLSVTTIFVLISLWHVSAKEYRYEFQRIVDIDPGSVLKLTYISGNLEITATDDDRIIISATKRVNAVNMDEAALVADHIEIKVERSGSEVAVITNYLRMRNRSKSFWKKVLGIGGEDSFGEVDWKIQVPRDCRVFVKNTSGDMIFNHIWADLDVKSSAANIDMIGIEGDIDIETTSGRTTGELLFGDVTVRQLQGEVDLKFVEGDVRLRTGSANVKMTQDRGGVDIATTTGNVEIQTTLETDQDFFVETESGNIEIIIPETSSGNLRIESQTGEIKTEMPVEIKSMTRRELNGKFGFGGINLTLVSVSGDIEIAQY